MSHHSQGHKSFPFPILIADVGGTNARFAIVSDAHAETVSFEQAPTAGFPGIIEAIQDTVLAHTSMLPRTAIIAVAGPVTGDVIPLTNADWTIEPRRMISELALEQVVILNDFEAQALALPGLDGDDLSQVGGGEPQPKSAKFVLGPGTGLGAAAMIHTTNAWIPVAGEGGHVELGPVSDEEYRVWPHIERVGGRIGAEQLLSGTGLPRLARAVVASEGADRTFQTAEDITQAAEAGDPFAVKAMEIFASALGRVAGDFALSVLARGGVYIAGGVTSHIADYLTEGSFRASFQAKAPHESLMASIPTYLVRHPNPALEGLAAYARAPGLFAVETSGRHWTAKPALKLVK